MDSFSFMAYGSGCGNPDRLVMFSDISGDDREFLMIICLVHGLSKKSQKSIRRSGLDAFAVDLKLLLRLRKSELGKHYNREKIPLGFQNPEFLASVLTEGRGKCMRWTSNAKASATEEMGAEELERRRAEDEAHRVKARIKSRRKASEYTEPAWKAAEERKTAKTRRAAKAAKAIEASRGALA